MKLRHAFFTFFIIFAAGIFPAAQASAASRKFNLIPENTYVGFTVGYFIVGTVRGRFDDFRGSFVMDQAHPENDRAIITIQTSSVNTGSTSRDSDVRGPHFFDTTAYPAMIFRSKKTIVSNDETGLMIGDLTLRGVTKPVTLTLTRIAGGTETDDPKSAGFKATGTIKRSAFGMNSYRAPISDLVTFYICYNMVSCGETRPATAPHYNN